MAPDLTSRQRWAPTLPRVLWLRTLSPDQGEYRRCHASRRSQRATGLRYIEKGLAGLPIQLGSRVSKLCMHVFKTPNVRAIMSMQDARASCAFNACKTCGQFATIKLHCSTGPVDHSQGTATVSGDTTGWSHVANRVRRGRAIRQGELHEPPKPSLVIPSHKNPSTVIDFQPPRDHLSGPGTQCNCPALSYKRIWHASI
jgi:hypothetical protein